MYFTAIQNNVKSLQKGNMQNVSLKYTEPADFNRGRLLVMYSYHIRETTNLVALKYVFTMKKACARNSVSGYEIVNC